MTMSMAKYCLSSNGKKGINIWTEDWAVEINNSNGMEMVMMILILKYMIELIKFILLIEKLIKRVFIVH